MTYTDAQFADILNATDLVIQHSLEHGQGTVHLQLRQQYAVARLTAALLSGVTLPHEHERLSIMLNRYCLADVITDFEFDSYLQEKSLALDKVYGHHFMMWTPAEVVQVTAQVLDEYEKGGLPLPKGYGEALRQLGYTTPEVRYDPIRLPLHACLPLPTLCSERQEAAIELLEALVDADGSTVYALLLLLYVNSRDRYFNVSVVCVLGDLRKYLSSAEFKSSRKVKPATARLIERHFEAMVKELRLRSNQLVGFKEAPVLHQEEYLANKVQFYRADANGLMRLTIFPLEMGYWQMMHVLEVELERTPTLTFSLHAQYTLLLVGALWCYEVSPGSGISTLQRLAAESLGVDPLWHWKEFCLPKWEHYGFANPAGFPYLIVALQAVIDAPLNTEVKHAARTLAVKAAGHLLACLSRMGIVLPDHGVVRSYLESFGPMPSLPLTKQEVIELEEDGYELVWSTEIAARSFAQSIQIVEVTLVVDSPSEIDDDPQDNVEPVYVSEARKLLYGKKIVLIGDSPDPKRITRLIDFFGLASLDWIGADEYAHGTHARHRIEGKADVVFLAIRWMGHAHSTLKDVARSLGIPCVYLPSGLNEQMVAMQVTQQMGERPERKAKSIKA